MLETVLTAVLANVALRLVDAISRWVASQMTTA